MVDLKEMLLQAVNIGQELTYLVHFGNDEPEIVSYLQLGIYLTINQKEIESIKIKLKE